MDLARAKCPANGISLFCLGKPSYEIPWTRLESADRLGCAPQIQERDPSSGTALPEPVRHERALARLREHFNDPLVTKAGRKMLLSPFAAELAPALHELLQTTETLVSARGTFDPATTERCFSLIGSDYTATFFLPILLQHLAARAPLVSVSIEEHNQNTFDQFDRGEIEMLIVPDQFAYERHPKLPLYQDKYVCVVWTGNRSVGRQLTLDTYMNLPHVVRYLRPHHQKTLDTCHLEAMGIERRAAVVSPAFTLVPLFVVGTDRIATIQERVARLYARSMPLRILKPPIPFPSMQWVLQWHQHQSSDPGLRWFREAVLSTAQRHLRDGTSLSRMPQLSPQMPLSVDARC